ncbi:MAG: very short patch repair endonuclease [Sphingomicrobium sp.]
MRKPSPARSRNMAAIGPKDTKPELIVRKLLHRAGFRFRLHRKDLPGKPDLTLPKWNALIEVQGCFFHSHDCHFVRKRPADNAEFWAKKLDGNVARDRKNAEAAAALGWRRLVVWQCALTGKARLDQTDLLSRISEWLRGNDRTGEIRGTD